MCVSCKNLPAYSKAICVNGDDDSDDSDDSDTNNSQTRGRKEGEAAVMEKITRKWRDRLQPLVQRGRGGESGGREGMEKKTKKKM